MDTDVALKHRRKPLINLPWKIGSQANGKVDLPQAVADSLKHNQPPSEDQKRRIMASKEQATLDLADIRAALAETNVHHASSPATHVQKLKEKEQIYIKQILACDAVMAPIRYVPLDVLQEIAFQLEVLHDQSSTYHRTSLVSLSQVCTSWRNAVTALPKLWSTLRYTLPKTASLARFRKMVASHFNRAGDHPLSFHLLIRGLESSGYGNACREILSWIFRGWKDIARVQSLEITTGLSWGPLTKGLRDSYPTKLDNLSCLCIRLLENNQFLHSFQHRGTFGGSFGTTFSQSQNLRRLSVGAHVLGEDPSLWHFPWKKLTHVFMSEILEASIWVQLLSLCTSLQHGYFTVSGNAPNVMGQPFTQHARLKHLTTIFENFVGDGLGFLKNITFPVLTSFEFKVIYHGALNHFDQPGDYSLSPAFPSLRKLSIPNPMDLAMNDIYAFLGPNHSLTHLEVGLGSGLALHALGFFKMRKDNCELPLYLPRLTKLVIEVTDFDDDKWIMNHGVLHFETKICQNFLEIIRSRFRPSLSSAQLKVAHLSMMRFPFDLDELLFKFNPQLQEYRDRGISIRVDVPTKSRSACREREYAAGRWDSIPRYDPCAKLGF